MKRFARRLRMLPRGKFFVQPKTVNFEKRNNCLPRRKDGTNALRICLLESNRGLTPKQTKSVSRRLDDNHSNSDDAESYIPLIVQQQNA